MLDPMALRLAVAAENLRGMKPFWSSLMHWHQHAPEPTDDWLASLWQVSKPSRVADGSEVIEVAEFHGKMTADRDVHIYGDLGGRITVMGRGDVVVAGDLQPGGSIHGSGMNSILIGGTLRGEVVNTGSSYVCVRGDLHGRVATGQPDCNLHVSGDCLGVIEPAGKPALLYLEVGGFMSLEAVRRTAAVGYVEFNAVIGHSDCPPGFYPDRETHRQLAEHRSYNRWAILAQAPDPRPSKG